MEIRQVLAKNVRKYRNQLQLSQEALAHAADLDRTYISGIERGLRNPTVIVLSQLAVALGRDASDLLKPN